MCGLGREMFLGQHLSTDDIGGSRVSVPRWETGLQRIADIILKNHGQLQALTEQGISDKMRQLPNNLGSPFLDEEFQVAEPHQEIEPWINGLADETGSKGLQYRVMRPTLFLLRSVLTRAISRRKEND